MGHLLDCLEEVEETYKDRTQDKDRGEKVNHKMILDIFEEFHRLRPDSVLMLIGTGELEDEIKYRAIHSTIANNVLFLGVKNDVQKYYQAMDAFLFPSTYEGLGIVLVEAQCASLQCFSSDVVPHEAKVSALVEFYSLEQYYKEWAAKMYTYKYAPRTNRRDAIINAGYEINSAAKELEDWYISQITH